MHPYRTPSRSPRSLLWPLALGLAPLLTAQGVPAPRPAAGQDPVALSTFEVTSTRDIGYQ